MYYLLCSTVYPIWAYDHKIEIKAYLLTMIYALTRYAPTCLLC